MKTIILLAVIAIVAADPKYYDVEKLDMDALVKNVVELKVFTDCLLDKIPCKKVYQSYRGQAMEAIEQACEKCSPHIKHVAWQYFEALKEKLPEEYLQFRQKYDPENKYFDAYENEIKKYANE